MTNLQTILLDELIALKKYVNRLLGMGILFIIMAHFFIIQPYFQYQVAQEKLLLEWNKSKDAFKNTQQKLQEIEKVDKQIKSVLEKVQQDIRSFPRELRNMLPKIDNELSSVNNLEARPSSRMALQIEASQPITTLPNEIKTLTEGVNWYTKNRLNIITNKLKKEIVEPLTNLNIYPKDKELEELFQKANIDITYYINKVNPDFWHTFGGKGRMASGLDNVVKKSFRAIFAEVNKAEKQLIKHKRLKTEEYTSLKADIQKLKKLKNNLENRLKSLDSPIGKLPLGLIDFIKLFPIIIVIFMIMLTFAISRSSYLYKKLNTNIELENKSIDKSIYNDIIECWYLSPHQNKSLFLLWGTLLLVSFIYIHITHLIIENQELFTSLIVQEESMQRYFYMGFYLLGGLIILACLSRIKKLNPLI